jgi:hypothetical protein
MVAIAARAAACGRPLLRDDLLELQPRIAAVLAHHEGFVAGAGVVLAPDALHDAPRWIEWWWADRGAGLERLAVDLDPESAEFYDYTTEEWYREPRRTGRPGIAGPYVDYICTHEYTFTLSVPLRQDGRFTGVAGADILAAQVERAVVPGLSRLRRVAVLTARNGRVIASNSPRFLPGTVLGREARDGELVEVSGCGGGDVPRQGTGSPVASLPWSLLAGGPREHGARP